ncbi:MAG TPA: Crp/Fnr family transcriptional regulator, partial [Halomonas campaniensis]|nr:Crp/Fnr family transcriptional regulator [Halomonas campaniensis]
MTSIFHAADANQLLADLPTAEQDALMANCETVSLTFGEELYRATDTVTHAYFPITSFISQIVILHGDSRLEVAMTGREGMLGLSLMLGIQEAPLLAVVQGAGGALRINAASFQRLLVECPVLHLRLKRYLYVVINQLANSAACIHFHRIEERLARWLLMTQDRAKSDRLQLTHEFLAMMLGVRRQGKRMK